ncbi:MAG: sulfite exporter TauE/SafE family protein [Candidatus Methylomirabilales bacterium]
MDLVPILAFSLLMGLGVSVLSGLLGIGGGIILAPALLYLPPLLGIGALDMRAVAGLTMTQALFACLSGAWRHRKYRFVCWSVVRWMGLTMLVASFMGAIASKAVRNEVLLGIFALLALTAALLMVLPQEENPSKDEVTISFNRPLAVAIALSVGFVGGLVGQGGSFILIPLMLWLLRLPLRVVLGSNLAIVAFASFSGFLGKLITHQIPLEIGAALVLGAVPGAQIGGIMSRRTPTPFLRGLLAVIILIAAVKMGYDTLAK